MKYNLLVVEDDSRIRKMIKDHFERLDYNVFEADNGTDAIRLFELEKIDIIFLDVMLPELDGFSVCSRLRAKSGVPIVMITARSQEEDKLSGFEYGADEYVTKPFSLRVLAARTENLLKRVSGILEENKNVYEYEKLRFNLKTEELTINANTILLTKKETDLLKIFIQNENIVVTKSQLLDKIWGCSYDGDPRTVDTHIRRLRAKLIPYDYMIHTNRNRGYYWGKE